ncbi:MAG TPA: mandelate racemase/muconate lactonizing enzyme family protein, partial [Methylomirabilota bacterium]|nr:mandelate racemase/muconate lactonizing enzyme family protein [Methylomirabilota bacterium]
AALPTKLTYCSKVMPAAKRAGVTAVGLRSMAVLPYSLWAGVARHSSTRKGLAMKVTGVDSFVLRVPTRKPIALEFPEHRLVVATVRTDEGVSGLGYSLVFGGGGAEAVHAYLATRLAPLLVGEDPRLVERLWLKMYRGDRGIRRVGVAGYALSALDIALWDLVGRAAGQPLHRLWGAVTDRVPAYGSGGWASYSLDELVGEAERYAALGCRYYKLKIHDPDPRANRERVAAVRRALGDRVRLMVDVNQKLDVDAAVRQARLLEDLDLVWYEEPVLADDVAACAEVARSIAIPVATGENHFTRYEFRELLERRAARYLMPDVCRANGFSETLRIGHLAAAHQVAVSPHVVHELSVHVVGALANGFLVEFIDWVPDGLFEGMPACADGHFAISERPGHGIALASGAERRYRDA